jgi:hypothetical protein
MRTTPFRRLLAAGALASAAFLPAQAEAQQPLLFGSWTFFDWFLNPGETAGPVNGDGFSFQSSHAIRLRVTDAGLSGDAFSIFVNGNPLAPTPIVAEGYGSGTWDGDEAWADPALSKLEYQLDPGTYTVNLAVRQSAWGTTEGMGFLRADEIVTTGVVPEPGTVALLATGLAGLLAAGARRRSRGR